MHHAFHTWIPSPLVEPKSIEIGSGSHYVTIFELQNYDDKYATYNNKKSMKQGICEMIPVLKKVIPLRVSVLKYTVASYLKHSDASCKAQTWQNVIKDVWSAA